MNIGIKNSKRVATPMSRRVKRFIRIFIPLTVWLVAIAVILFLSQGSMHRTDIVGVVDWQNAVVTPLLDGVVQSIMDNELLDTVEAGEVVVVLSDPLLAVEQKTAKAELAKLQAELKLANSDIERKNLNDLRRFENNVEEARLDVLDRIVDLKTDEVALALLEVSLKREERLLKANATSRELYDDVRLNHEALQTKIKENEKAITFARERLAMATKRRSERISQAETDDAVAEYLQPLQEAINVQEAVLTELSTRADQLILRSPISGTISEINVRSGEAVRAGTEIMGINSISATRVLAWVNEKDIHNLKIGQAVELSTRRKPQDVIRSQIIKVGTKIERFPLRLQPNPNLPHWGVAIMVSLPLNGKFYPGEILDLHFLTPGTTGGAG